MVVQRICFLNKFVTYSGSGISSGQKLIKKAKSCSTHTKVTPFFSLEYLDKDQ